ncbi:MAG: patatin family protein [Crocinitomicaceae bacterium]|nr:patatin family protein [Crocinitomicaceae bacterium]MDG1734576.1 patatin family protein [Crocinitomicaceae bacterium]MDG2505930.1 patatin family protein [Crocinitomicaceae bacterium]
MNSKGIFSGKKVLILEGGGFKTSFTGGVLDAFRSVGHDPFDAYIGVSGGSIAISYFLSEKYGYFYQCMRMLCQDERFIKYSKAFSDGLMNLDFFKEIAEKEFPFDFDIACEKLLTKDYFIVLTDSELGTSHYLQPNRENWIDMTIAASTVPMLTKGKHSVNGIDYSDGGISDPIPIRWAVENGATDIVLIRTTHYGFNPGMFRPEYIVSKFLRASEKIIEDVENFQFNIKAALDYIETLPNEIKVQQIAPESPLNTQIFTNSVKSIALDYRTGLESGLNYFQKVQ